MYVKKKNDRLFDDHQRFSADRLKVFFFYLSQLRMYSIEINKKFLHQYATQATVVANREQRLLLIIASDMTMQYP